MENPDFEQFDRVVLVITKEYIDNEDFEHVNDILTKLMENSIKNENKLSLIIDGYDNDLRELYEIPEIRNYFQTLDRLFPYWFYFVNRKTEEKYSSLVIIMLLLVPLEVIGENKGKKNIEYDIIKFNEFMSYHFHYLNELTDKLGFSLEENKRISMEVIEAFK